MKDEEIALKLVELYCKNRTVYYDESTYWEVYTYFLEEIKSYKSETIKGKIEYKLKEFYENTLNGISPVYYDELIKDITKILEEN